MHRPLHFMIDRAPMGLTCVLVPERVSHHCGAFGHLVKTAASDNATQTLPQCNPRTVAQCNPQSANYQAFQASHFNLINKWPTVTAMNHKARIIISLTNMESVTVPPAGGFTFDLCQRSESNLSFAKSKSFRNAMLERTGLKTPKSRKTGTTIAGIVFKVTFSTVVFFSHPQDGVVLGADTRATEVFIYIRAHIFFDLSRARLLRTRTVPRSITWPQIFSKLLHDSKVTVFTAAVVLVLLRIQKM